MIAHHVPAAGLIPTYAGNTLVRPRSAHPAKAHPHVCGEHRTPVSGSVSIRGSSPRMRGTLSTFMDDNARAGLIPTYAGNTSPRVKAGRSRWAHPHVCGEHPRPYGRCRSTRGSSPRMRGTRGAVNPTNATHGLIPTYAGNTLADMGFYPHTPSFRISLEPKASINPTRFLGLSPSGSAPIPASFAPPFSWP